MNAATLRHLVWVCFSSLIFGLVIATAVTIFAVSYWFLDMPADDWWFLTAIIVGFALGPIYHALVWFNSRTR